MGAQSFDRSHGAPSSKSSLPNETPHRVVSRISVYASKYGANETWGPDAEPEPRTSELQSTQVLVRKPASAESLLSTDSLARRRDVSRISVWCTPRAPLSIDSLADVKARRREVSRISVIASKYAYGVHPSAPFKSDKAAGNKKKTQRRNQSSLSSLSVGKGKEFSRRAKDTSNPSRIIGMSLWAMKYA